MEKPARRHSVGERQRRLSTYQVSISNVRRIAAAELGRIGHFGNRRLVTKREGEERGLDNRKEPARVQCFPITDRAPPVPAK